MVKAATNHQRMGVFCRAVGVGCVVALASAAVSGCASGRDQAAELAAAKCATPTLAQASPNSDVAHEVVTKLNAGRRRVTGIVVEPSGSRRDFTCVVEPDASDKLRGLRIVSLTVSPPTGP